MLLEYHELVCRLTFPLLDRCIFISWGNKSKHTNHDLTLLFLLHPKYPPPSLYATHLELIFTVVYFFLSCLTICYAPSWSNLGCRKQQVCAQLLAGLVVPMTRVPPLACKLIQLWMKPYCLDGEQSTKGAMPWERSWLGKDLSVFHSNGSSRGDVCIDYFKALCGPQKKGTILVQDSYY